jgi:hypothetical protein
VSKKQFELDEGMSGSDRRENRENEDDFLKDFNPDEFSSPMVFAPQVPPPPPNTEQQETQNSKVCLSLQLFRMVYLTYISTYPLFILAREQATFITSNSSTWC